MPKKPLDDVQSNKPASKAEQQAARETTKDGLKKARDARHTRDEVLEQKTSQGQPSRG